ncbi:protein translocase subunit SecD [Mycolicibacillus trivialis]|uniref:Protein translocase subunit SecD n=1 Tax=Mycolicibacillus trivialis TaxID=1798 RepID=A0A1X2EPJ0_9MYCO|nr:protein translocase subunit SecD [Mycolicibacillus trivialis]ORX07908.1 preprotein translocase subunit SecD [Mycolicibacillus trivialis]
MASPSAPVQPARYLSVFLALLIGTFLLVFLTGDKKPEPKLGIDLQGGTRVTLTARTPDGSRPTRDALAKAQEIIGARVNGLGVSGSEVVIDGDNLVITVPGNDGDEARNLGQTARLYIRPVLEAIPARSADEQQQQPQLPAEGLPDAGLPGELPAEAPPADGAEPTEPTPAQTAPPAPQPRPFPQEPAPSPEPGPEPSPSTAPTPGGDQPDDAEGPAAPGDKRQALADRIEMEKQLRQSDNQFIQIRALLAQSMRCGEGEEDVLAGNDDPTLPLVTCSTDGKTAYLLAPSIISGDQIKDATSGMDQQGGGNIVELTYKSEAADTWADFTARNVGTATAFTLDSQVVSAPQIQEAIPGGRTRISGNFTQSQARELANVLKYGSLPLSFEASEAQTVSASLGLRSMEAGLIAGAIGLLLVLIYALVYYRVLGILTALSLVLAGVMAYGILVLLGRYINYTLDLAGIAGLIIGIGTTADSFVVYFERIKDEIREGRSYRSAVPRGWVRARKTIVSGNAVTFLAAAVLYVLAVGQVKGFAFTLGLITVLDLVVVFLVTWPLVYLTSKSTTLAKPAYNGLGAVQQVARERRALGRSAAGTSTGRG